MTSRRAIRAIEAAARAAGEEVWLVGGIVRDAFLALPSKDIDVACRAGSGERLAGLISAALGGRQVAVGKPPRQIIKIVSPLVEVDLWEIEDPASDSDLTRRDFTINTFRLSLPARELTSVAGAETDLRKGLLKLPRPGVLIEDPVRVLRAARFIAHFPWLRMDSLAREELSAAAGRLPETAAERRLAEFDRLLPVTGREAEAALSLLERWNALSILMPGSTRRERRQGCRLVGQSSLRDPGFLRVLLLLPLGSERVEAVQDSWRVPRRERDLARHLLDHVFEPSPLFSERGNVVRLIRSSHPFVPETLEVLRLSSRPGLARIVEQAARLSRSRKRLDGVLSPRRPAPAAELFALAALPPGPARAQLLEDVDCRLAAGEIRTAAALRRFAAESGRRSALTPDRRH